MDQKLLDKADTEYARFCKELPKPNDQLLATLGAKVEVLRQVQLEARLNDLVRKAQYYTAHELICDAKKPYLTQRGPEIRKAGAEFYKAKAQQDLGLGGSRVPYGFFAAEKAWELNPDDEEIFKLRKEPVRQGGGQRHRGHHYRPLYAPGKGTRRREGVFERAGCVFEGKCALRGDVARAFEGGGVA